jgi:hypothetical protein
MCYCEFHDIIDSIRALDADVIFIETSRSHGELIQSFEEHTYELGIGLGVYDIHSPRVSALSEMVNISNVHCRCWIRLCSGSNRIPDLKRAVWKKLLQLCGLWWMPPGS